MLGINYNLHVFRYTKEVDSKTVDKYNQKP